MTAPIDCRADESSPKRETAFVSALFFGVALILSPACRPRLRPINPPPPSEIAVRPLSSPIFAIQVGVFSKAENANRLVETLKAEGIEASVFAIEQRAFKVCIGRYATRQDAERSAGSLHDRGAIAEFLIVALEGAALAGLSDAESSAVLRTALVETARGFIDAPYSWGGTSAEQGFDCSGLTMTVYRLNGIDLPRSLGDQFNTGHPVAIDALEKGDLVFFDTSRTGTATHVGVYIGDGVFIHAPGANKTIRTDSLFNAYYHDRFLGGRSYL